MNVKDTYKQETWHFAALFRMQSFTMLCLQKEEVKERQ